MKKAIILVLVLAFFLTGNALAELVFKAEVDKKKMTTDELLTYKLIVTSTDKIVPQPEPPEFDGFKVVSRAKSSTISFAKEGPKTVLVYVFILLPDKPGHLKIPPSILKAGDKKAYSSEAFEIEVAEGQLMPQEPAKEKPPLPKDIPPESQEPKITL